MKKGAKQPYREVYKRDAKLSKLRRFGCFVYVKRNPKEQLKAMDPKAEKGVYLGRDQHTGKHLAGVWHKDGRAKRQLFKVLDDIHLTFFEDTLVSNVDELQKGYKALTVPFSDFDPRSDYVSAESGAVTDPGFDHPANPPD